MILVFLVIIFGFLFCGGIIAVAVFVVYHIVSTARMLKQNSRLQTRLLQEIKALMEETVERKGSDDVI